jgi:hypothetical protein
MPNQTVLEQQIDEMRSDMRDMRGAVTKMAEAMTKLSVLEERNQVANLAIQKINERVEKVEDKAAAAELSQARFESRFDGMATTMKIMWGAFGSGVLYIGSQVIKQFAG